MKHASAKNWVTVSKFHQLSDQDILDSVSGQTQAFRGCRWSAASRFLVLDIDAGSKYHSVQGLEQIVQALQDLGIERYKLYQSSRSGGWHLYVFWYSDADCDLQQKLFKRALLAAGLEIRGGTLEIFPSGNALRFPLQSGFAWIDEQGNVKERRESLSLAQALDLFLADMQNYANNWDRVHEALQAKLLHESSIQSGQDPTSGQGMSGQSDDMVQFDRMVLDATREQDEDRWHKGREYWINGLTARNQRHDAILYVGYYLWFGDRAAGLSPLPGRRNAAQRERQLRDWLTRKHHGQCRHISAGKLEKVEEDIRRAVYWRRNQAMAERTPYLVTERLIERQMETHLTIDQMRRANEKRERLARTKILWALRELQRTGKNVSIKALQRASGCSINTVRRHRDIWFAGGSGDLSPGALTRLDVPLDPGLGSGVIVLSTVRDQEKEEEKEIRGSGDLGSPDAVSGPGGLGQSAEILAFPEVSVTGCRYAPGHVSQLRLLFPGQAADLRVRGSWRSAVVGRSPPQLE